MYLPFKQRYIPIVATILICLLLYGVAAVTYPGFLSLQVLVNFIYDNSFIGIIALGMTFVILTGGIDLSVGSMVAFSGVLIATLTEGLHFHPAVAIALALAAGTIFGLLMGCIIHFYEAPPFIVTLGGMFLARGLAQIMSLESIPIYHPFFEKVNALGINLNEEVLLPALALIFLAVFAIAVYIAHLTRFGRNVYAIGGNLHSATLLGVPIGKTRLLVYAFSGFLSALGGAVYTFYTSAGYGLAGLGLELDAIAAVVIGGTLITGGVGYVAGTLIGVLILGIIQTFISFNGNLSSHWTRIVIGVLITAFILLQKLFSSINLKQKPAKSAKAQVNRSNSSLASHSSS